MDVLPSMVSTINHITEGIYMRKEYIYVFIYVSRMYVRHNRTNTFIHIPQ